MTADSATQPPVIGSNDLLHCAAILDAYMHRNQTLWQPYTARIIEVLRVAGTRGANPTTSIAAPAVDAFIEQLRALPWPADVDGADATE